MNADRTIDGKDGWNSWLPCLLSAPHTRQALVSAIRRTRTCTPDICYRFRTMKITRRAALKSSALAATALALGGPRIFSQASTVGRCAHRHPSRRADRHHLAGDLLPLHRASGRRDLRRRVGRPRFEDRQYQWNPPGLYRHHEGRAGPSAALAGRLLRRLVRLARRPGRRGQSPRAHRLLGPAGPQPVRPARVYAHLPRHRMQAVSGCRHALAAGARLLPGDRVLQRASRPGAVELRRPRHAQCAGRPARGQWRSRALQCGPVGRRQRELGMRRQPCAGGVRGDVPPLYRVDAELQQARRCASSPSGPMETTWTGRAACSRACTPTPSGAISSASPSTTTPRAAPRGLPKAMHWPSTQTSTTTC